MAQPPFYIAMGASGSQGLKDIKAMLALLPSNTLAVVLVVLHRPSDRISHLREVLSGISAMPVLIAEHGGQFDIGSCYIGEPADHLTLAASDQMQLVSGGHHEYRNRTVDLLFASVAQHAKDRAIGVVLSGSLDDGSRGLAAIHAAGGTTMVIETETVGFEGMPENAKVYDGPIDFVGSVGEIADAVIARTGLAHQSTERGTLQAGASDEEARVAWWSGMSEPSQRNVMYHAETSDIFQAWSWHKLALIEDAAKDPIA